MIGGKCIGCVVINGSVGESVSGLAHLVLCELLRPLCYSVRSMLILFSAREIGWIVIFVRTIICIEMFDA